MRQYQNYSLNLIGRAMKKVKVKITIEAEISSPEYENHETMIDELSSECMYEIPSTDCVDVHETALIDIQLV